MAIGPINKIERVVCVVRSTMHIKAKTIGHQIGVYCKDCMPPTQGAVATDTIGGGGA